MKRILFLVLMLCMVGVVHATPATPTFTPNAVVESQDLLTGTVVIKFNDGDPNVGVGTAWKNITLPTNWGTYRILKTAIQTNPLINSFVYIKCGPIAPGSNIFRIQLFGKSVQPLQPWAGEDVRVDWMVARRNYERKP